MKKRTEKQKIVLIAVLIAISCFLTYYFHATLNVDTVFFHFFYIPILLSSIWWKRKGIAIAIFLALFLLLNHIIFRNLTGTYNDYCRAVMFVVIASIVSFLSERLTKSEKELKKSLELSRTFLNATTDGAVLLDRQGIIHDINDVCAQRFHKSSEEMIGLCIWDLFPSEITENRKKNVNKVFDSGEPVSMEDEQNGMWNYTNIYPVCDSPGEVNQVLVFAHDITERKQHEQMIRDREERLSLALLGGDLGTWDWNIRTNDVYFNQRWAEMKGYSADDTEPHVGSWESRVHPDDLPKVMEKLNAHLEGKIPIYDAEFRTRHKSGEWMWILDRGKVVQWDADGHPVRACGAHLDITEQVCLRKEKEKLHSQLQQAQKMESIGTLAGGIAHDFNNILTTIIGNAALALMDVGKDGILREEIEDIKIAGERGASLTRQLLAFSRKQIIHPEVLDLNELLTDVEKMLGRLIGEDVELLMIPEPSLWQVEVDPGQVEQVIMNLAVNARDAMPMGGKLMVETANVDLDGDYFQEHGIEAQAGPYVMLSVSDTGSGMDKGTQERIFEPFFTTKERGKGTGLGLSTVYGIVKQSKGFIWAYSEPGQGTTFKVYLPKAKGGAEPVEKEQLLVEDLGGSETVLIVEDDDRLRKLAQKVLQSFGYRVIVAENGEDALKVSQEHDGSIDLLLTDVVMPKMGGKETAERLQPLYPHMKVIYMSGYTDNAIVLHGVLAPGLNFLEKPFSPEALVRTVRKVLDEKQD